MKWYQRLEFSIACFIIAVLLALPALFSQSLITGLLLAVFLFLAFIFFVLGIVVWLYLSPQEVEEKMEKRGEAPGAETSRFAEEVPAQTSDELEFSEMSQYGTSYQGSHRPIEHHKKGDEPR